MEYDFFERIVLEACYRNVYARTFCCCIFDRINADFASFGVGLGDYCVGVMSESVAQLQNVAIRGAANAHGMAAFIFI